MSLFIYAAIATVVLFVTVAMAQASGGGTVYIENPTDKIRKFAGGIAFAEGYWDASNNVLSGNRAARNNNPGDFLGSGDAGTDGIYAVYSTAERGFQRLYGQLQLIVDGKSNNYNLDMTISDMAYVYTATEQDAWSENVSTYLGVSRDTKLRGLLT